MKGNSEVIVALNGILSKELAAINQYFLHARMFKNWGLEALNDRDYKMSIIKMKNADALIERILFLEGLPNLQYLGKINIGENSEEMIQSNYTMECEEHVAIKEAIELCEQHEEYVSRLLLEKILLSLEDQIDWLEVQQHLIEHSGIENYLQSQMEDD